MAGIPIGTRQRQPCSSFTSPLCSTRHHTRLHTRPTHSLSKEVRLDSLHHFQECRLKLFIPFQELRLDSRLRAFGSRALRPSRLTSSRVLWFDTTYHALPYPGFAPYPIPGLWFYTTYLLIYNTPQRKFSPYAGFNPPGFSFISFFRRLATYLCHVVSLHQ